jgi:hypothetical protein
MWQAGSVDGGMTFVRSLPTILVHGLSIDWPTWVGNIANAAQILSAVLGVGTIMAVRLASRRRDDDPGPTSGVAGRPHGGRGDAGRPAGSASGRGWARSRRGRPRCRPPGTTARTR